MASNIAWRIRTHHVFVAHLVDQNFQNKFDENGFFDDLENTNFTLSGGNHTLNNYFGIDFRSLVLSWTPGSTIIHDLFDIDATPPQMYTDAKSALGLAGNWSDTQGTSSHNHGFDLLFAHSWEINTCTFHSPCGAGRSYQPDNRAIVMAGYYKDGNPDIPPILINCSLVTLHEILHTYDCAHVETSGYIMHYNDADFSMHSGTENTLWSNIDQYDGF